MSFASKIGVVGVLECECFGELLPMFHNTIVLDFNYLFRKAIRSFNLALGFVGMVVERFGG